jgi:hypothetical protein
VFADSPLIEDYRRVDAGSLRRFDTRDVLVTRNDTLVRRYGVDAPKTLLLTIGRPDFARGLEGLALWQVAFQLSGFYLNVVFDDYARRVKDWELEFASLIADLPRPRGSLVRNDELVGVAVRLVCG